MPWGGGAAMLPRAPVTAHSGMPSAVPAMNHSPSRATETTIVDRALPPAPLPPPPTRGIPRGDQVADDAADVGAATTGKRPAPACARAAATATSARRATGDVDDGLSKVRGVTGRWEYDDQHARWILVLPPD